ncbi:hypothetical protein CVT24_008461 [Panaeolus cyanescens]|uniref:Uncharacterized protein n=1 Tax=Panaeolus cyanescens TaxID=181874 RepID=A0A409VD57_9AGAR|nr:hypothetical protein CVT24_008461 [Panaeolus cyanescens]
MFFHKHAQILALLIINIPSLAAALAIPHIESRLEHDTASEANSILVGRAPAPEHNDVAEPAKNSRINNAEESQSSCSDGLIGGIFKAVFGGDDCNPKTVVVAIPQPVHIYNHYPVTGAYPAYPVAPYGPPSYRHN